MPFDMTEADSQMVYYKPLVCLKKKSEEINRSQHLTFGIEEGEDSEEIEGS